MTSQTQSNISSPPDNWAIDTYRHQRKERLDDAVADYLTDDSISAVTFYDELVEVLREWEQYHDKHLNNVRLALKLVNAGASRVDGDAIQSEMECPEGLTKRWDI